MHRLLLILLSFNFGSFFACDRAYFNDRIGDSKLPITPSFYGGVIHLSDLDTSVSAGGAMFTINASGRYYVSSDLSISPDNNRVAAIQISANNVLLDLNSAIIYQRSSNSATGLMGIEVDSSKSNIRILNGVISGLDVSDSSEQNAGIVIKSSASNVVIQDVTVTGCTTASSSNGREVSGFLLDGCNNVKLINCESSNNINGADRDGSNAGSVNGFKLTSSANACSLESCVANRNASTNESSFGFSLDSSKYNKIINCTALNQISDSSTSGDVATGYYTSDGAGNLFQNCISNGNTGGISSGSIGAGFVLGDGTATNEKFTTIVNSRIEGNDGGTGDGYGIRVTSGVSFCSARGNIILGNTGANSGYGIRDLNTLSKNIYIKNFGFTNGTSDGSTINNFDFDPLPSGSAQVTQGKLNSLSALNSADTGYFNLEVVDAA